MIWLYIYGIILDIVVIIVRVQRHVCKTFLHAHKLDTSVRGSDRANY